jgi:hypothetical protein
MSKAKIIDHRAQSKFICAKCGSARDCDCNAPAREREAARKEATSAPLASEWDDAA